jgi:UDP-hydrolysing UDP-N-acetyl-D-glucosamine 2-epimerase
LTKRRIAVFTGNRAEYGLLYPVLLAIKESDHLDLELIVSGAHLDADFGNTIGTIKKDGFDISAEVQIPFKMDNKASTSQAIGSAILSLTNVFTKIKPDLVIVYADRFEGFAATIAASQMSIPTAHIEGGDLTEGGALDDSVRHAMTKLSHLHFATNQQAANRIASMGEEEWRIHNVGFTGIDLIALGKVSPKEEVLYNYNLDPEKPIILFTQHSVAAEVDLLDQHINSSLNVLCHLAKENCQVIITYPNNDYGSDIIIKTINDHALLKYHHNIQIHKSLGQQNYYGVLSLALDEKIKVVCVGNSSSGIKETAAFGCPTVNIGSRQSGRLHSTNVLNSTYLDENILTQINKALHDACFRKSCQKAVNPYGVGDASKKIVEIISEIPLDKKLLTKKMTLRGVFDNASI